MDGVVVFFASAPAPQVNAYAGLSDHKAYVGGGDVHFLLRPYSGWVSELDEAERVAVVSCLGGTPSSAFSIEARHGGPARLALEWLAECASHLGAYVIDDDFGHLWSAADVERVMRASDESDIYALRAEV